MFLYFTTTFLMNLCVRLNVVLLSPITALYEHLLLLLHQRVGICGVAICPRVVERQTIIVSICNVACSVCSNPEAVSNLLYSVGCHRCCQ